MQIANEELQHISSSALTIGSITGGAVELEGITPNATSSTGDILPTQNPNAPTTLKNMELTAGLDVQAHGGIIIEGDITANGDVVLMTGSSALTVRASYALSTSNNLLTITSDNVELVEATGGVYR